MEVNIKSIGKSEEFNIINSFYLDFDECLTIEKDKVRINGEFKKFKNIYGVFQDYKVTDFYLWIDSFSLYIEFIELEVTK